MSDTATETAPVETAPAETGPATNTAPAQTSKEKVQPHACLCSTFVLIDPEDKDTEFTTECTSTTMRVFAQGHDARLVSFLVNGLFDGYSIAQDKDGSRVLYDNPGHAAASASETLGEKADKAVANEKAKRDAKDAKKAERDKVKAERDAAKVKAKADKAAAKAAAKPATTGPREVGAKVVKESVVGDGTPVVPAAGDHLIVKVGRGEYEADVEQGTGELEGKLVARYRNLQGVEEVRDIELTRVLRRA